MNDKNFYIMLADPPSAGPTQTLISGPDIMVHSGEWLEGIEAPFEIVLQVDTQAQSPLDFPPLDIHGPNRSLLFSERFIGILDKLGVETIQYLDAAVSYGPTGAKVPYKVANIVGLVEGLNREASDLDLSPKGTVLSIEQMQLDEEKLSEQKIFRLQEDDMLIVVHKSIREAVEAAGLTGFLFVADDEYEPGMI